MEYCTDGTLHELIHQKRNGEMQMDEVYELYIQLCRGMRYCHEKGVVHRDLRVSSTWKFQFSENILQPDNVFMHHNCKLLKIGDFGISEQLKYEGQQIETKLERGFPAYVAIELYCM